MTKKKNKITSVLAIGAKFLTKALSISAKITKLALAGASLSVYTYLYSWQFALIIMIQLFTHEYGHILAMKRVGIKTKGIYFIPFVGGAAVASETFKSRYDEVFVALMGPIFGFGCAIITLITYYCTNNPMFAAAASWMAMMNFFNLLPINPLDGGRVMKSIAFSMHSKLGFVFMSIGILASIWLAIYVHIWIFILVVIASALELALELYIYNKEKKKALLIEDLTKERDQLIVKMNEISEKIDKSNATDDQKENLYDKLREIDIELLNIPSLDDEFKIKPEMSLYKILLSAFIYFTLTITLYWFMTLTIHIPGAKLALELLQ